MFVSGGARKESGAIRCYARSDKFLVVAGSSHGGRVKSQGSTCLSKRCLGTRFLYSIRTPNLIFISVIVDEIRLQHGGHECVTPRAS